MATWSAVLLLRYSPSRTIGVLWLMSARWWGKRAAGLKMTPSMPCPG
jgi:hypothetical protein